MTVPSDIYRPSLALLTDLYQLTMACGYFKAGLSDHQAVFNLFFRQNPFGGGFSVACGLEYVIDYLERLRFDPHDLAYLATLRGNDDRPLFDPAFLDYLAKVRFDCDLDAVPEGTPVFPHEPLLRVRGPIISAQLVETALLNIVNFQTLIATKAARVCLAAGDDPVLEFGLRRAQGIDGGLSVARAACIGGCAATSNVLAGRLLGLTVSGTLAHSWIMLFASELEAFEAYAQALPNNCVLLVDTYDTLAGVRNAIEIGRRLRRRGFKLAGIRLDSGDLAYLSIEARKLLDEAGFAETRIVASNELDEYIIESLKAQGARIDIWGVGTRLATAYDQPALGGVYKLTAVRPPDGPWQYRLKLSEQAVKTSIPGILQVRRFRRGDEYVGDMIYDAQQPPTADQPLLIDPLDSTRRKRIPAGADASDLLVPVFRAGRRVYDPPPLDECRQRLRRELRRFHPGIRRFVNPHLYPVGLDPTLHDLRTRLILAARG